MQRANLRQKDTEGHTVNMAGKYLIVGLGNPGRKYEQTRHNVGFGVVEALATRHNLTASTTERKALTTDGIINGKRVILTKPQTYMNLSGEAVRALTDYYKIDLDRLIVIYDDMDLALGTLRLRPNGGHGGQNGMRNIIQHLGTREFARIRFGIGRPPGRMKGKDYVLQPFYGDDKLLAQQVTDTAADAVELWLAEGIEVTMTQFNGDVTETDEAPEPPPQEQLKLAQRAHELDPDNHKPLQQMIGLYKRLGDLKRAADTHLKLAALYDAKDKPKSTIIEMERAVSLRPELVEIQRAIANAYEDQGNNKRAVGRWLKLVDYHIDQADTDAVQEALLEALRLNPQHPKARELAATYSIPAD